MEAEGGGGRLGFWLETSPYVVTFLCSVKKGFGCVFSGVIIIIIIVVGKKININWFNFVCC